MERNNKECVNNNNSETDRDEKKKIEQVIMLKLMMDDGCSGLTRFKMEMIFGQWQHISIQ